MSASQLISNMIWMNYDHNKKFGLLKVHSGYGKFNLNSPKGYSLKIINAQTDKNSTMNTLAFRRLFPQCSMICVMT